jgi:predicted  nucleic acid-binding Zn-ribbon protein
MEDLQLCKKEEGIPQSTEPSVRELLEKRLGHSYTLSNKEKDELLAYISFLLEREETLTSRLISEKLKNRECEEQFSRQEKRKNKAVKKLEETQQALIRTKEMLNKLLEDTQKFSDSVSKLPFLVNDVSVLIKY